MRKISEIDSRVILLSLKGLSSLGFSLPKALKLLEESEDNKKVRSILNFVNTKIRNDSNVSEVLHSVGMISEIEKFILNKSNNLTRTIETIMFLRTLKNRFEKNMIGIFITPIIVFCLTLAGVLIIEPKLISVIDFVANLVKRQKGIVVDVELEWWLIDNNIRFVKYTLISFITLILIGLSLYYYGLKYNRKKIYSMFKTKAYDDIPLIFSNMKSLRDNGVPGHVLVDVLYRNTSNKSFKDLYNHLKHSITSNDKTEDKFYLVFRKFNFPRDIVSILKSSELSKNLWTSFDNIIEYAKIQNEIKNEKLKMMISKPLLFSAYGIAIYFLVSIILNGVTVMSMMINLME